MTHSYRRKTKSYDDRFRIVPAHADASSGPLAGRMFPVCDNHPARGGPDEYPWPNATGTYGYLGIYTDDRRIITTL
jgi:hypothetical protein